MLYVIKLGGSPGTSQAAAIADIADLVRRGEQVVLLHGCSFAADQLARELGEPVRYVTSITGVRSRYTDARMLRIFTMAAAQVNADLVLALQREGIRALGLSGVDGGVLRGIRKDVLRVVEDGRQRVLRDDYTGRLESVNVSLLRLLLDHDYVPVIAPLALGLSGATLDAVNVDGDRAAALVAASLGAPTLIILSNVPGLLADADDEGSLISQLALEELAEREALVAGGMRRKLIGAREALVGGVRRVLLADGRAEHPVRAALAGRGTVIA
ncbi:MAG: [LysW]-aminoadipate kinase [Ktedonobacterales bacterium]